MTVRETESRVRCGLGGSGWVSADDPQSRIEIFGSEQTDIYGAEVPGVSVLSLGDFCDDAQGGVLLRVQQMGGDPADIQCFAVLDITGSRMELSHIGRGNTLVYLRPWRSGAPLTARVDQPRHQRRRPDHPDRQAVFGHRQRPCAV